MTRQIPWIALNTERRLFLGRRRNIRHVWAYMLLGQLVAISVATNLFFGAVAIARELSPSTNKKEETEEETETSAPLTLVVPVLFAFATIARSPHTTSDFLANLLAMHGALFVPLLAPSALSARGPRVRVSTLYTAVGVLSFLLRLRAWWDLIPSALGLRGVPRVLFRALNDAHPAQSSISWDVVCTTLSFAGWAAMGSDGVDLVRVGQTFCVSLVVGVARVSSVIFSKRLTEEMKTEKLGTEATEVDEKAAGGDTKEEGVEAKTA